jgi:hypothetical protein
MRALALVLAFAPLTALAQPAPIAPAPATPAAAAAPPAPAAPPAMPGVEPSECVTTTTVRCTGAAAPYAVQPAPTVVVPPTAPQLAAPGLLLNAPLGNGWTLVQTPDGHLWRQREVHGSQPGVWATGLTFWMGAYVASIVGGVSQGDGSVYFMTLPFMGPFLNAGLVDHSDTGRALWVLDGFVQIGGFVAFVVGASTGPSKTERLPITIAPTAIGSGQGVALQGSF